MINASILNIGDEILIGQIIDTNSSFLCKKLNEINIPVSNIVTIGDDEDTIIEHVENLMNKSQIIIIGGGLGPTSDDKTKSALCKFFNKRLILNDDIVTHIKNFLIKRGIKNISERNLKQAEVPEGCELIPNPNGTAWGLIFEKNNKICVALPGVPHEFKSMVENYLIFWIKNKFKINSKIIHHTFLTTGIPESVMADKLKDFENNLPKNIKLAYLPSPGILSLRLSAFFDTEDIAETLKFGTIKNELFNLIKDYCFGENEDKLEKVVGNLLIKFNLTISIAESCTGGYVQHLLTTIPGSSQYFKGGIVAYSNEIKSKILNVDTELLYNKGAVSEEIVKMMAKNIKNLFNTDYSIAISGIAGPTGGSEDKPVGTTWIAVAGKKTIETRLFKFGDERINNIIRASIAALDMVRKLILSENC